MGFTFIRDIHLIQTLTSSCIRPAGKASQYDKPTWEPVAALSDTEALDRWDASHLAVGN